MLFTEHCFIGHPSDAKVSEISMFTTGRGIICTIHVPRVPECVCPFVRIGSPRPLSHKRVCPPPLETKGGCYTRLRGEGAGGANSDDWSESPGTLYTLCAVLQFLG
jgi:hypothetical protein